MVMLYDRSLFEEVSDLMLLRINGKPVWCGDPEIEQGKPFSVETVYQGEASSAWMHPIPLLSKGGETA